MEGFHDIVRIMHRAKLKIKLSQNWFFKSDDSFFAYFGVSECVINFILGWSCWSICPGNGILLFRLCWSKLSGHGVLLSTYEINFAIISPKACSTNLLLQLIWKWLLTGLEFLLEFYWVQSHCLVSYSPSWYKLWEKIHCSKLELKVCVRSEGTMQHEWKMFE